MAAVAFALPILPGQEYVVRSMGARRYQVREILEKHTKSPENGWG